MSQRGLSELDLRIVRILLKECGYRNVLRAIMHEADAMHSTSGQEMAGKLDGLLGNFGYFPVCSIEGEGAIGHDYGCKGVCPECGAEEK